MMKILIAEDEIGIAETYQVILEARGHDVTTTSDGAECLRVYKKALEDLDYDSAEYIATHPPFDVVVLDYRMPKMDGLEAAKFILEANKNQRIIFASSYVMSTLQESVKQLHAVVELLQKPFELEVMVDIIEDKSVNKELKRINENVKALNERNSVEELRELLQSLKKLNSKTPLVR